MKIKNWMNKPYTRGDVVKASIVNIGITAIFIGVINMIAYWGNIVDFFSNWFDKVKSIFKKR